MPEPGPIEMSATVLEVLSPVECIIRTARGKRLNAVVAGHLRMSFTRVLPGAKVSVSFRPYDLSQGRIVAVQDV